jgi:hypothetical protein
MIKLVGSIIFTGIVFVIFNIAVASSRSDLRVGLVDVYGDTSGIRSLTIEGRVTGGVSSFAGPGYGYTFAISPQTAPGGIDASVDFHVFNHNRGYTNFVGIASGTLAWNHHFFETRYVPVGAYEIVEIAEGNSHMLYRGEWTPMPEWRIYSELFAVEVRLHGHRVVVPGRERAYFETTAHRLFLDAGEGAFLVGHSADLPLAQFSNNFWTIGRVNHRWLHTGFNIPLVDSFVTGDVHVFVPTGPRLFGTTSVYAVNIENRQLNLIGAFTDEINLEVHARALIDIELERGRDEILGMIQLENGFLLLIMRGGNLEIFRYCFESGEVLTQELTNVARPHQIYEQGGTLVFTSHEQEQIMWTIDVADGGLAATEPAAFALGGGEWMDYFYSRPWIHVHDVMSRGGYVYFAYTFEEQAWLNRRSAVQTFISVFDTNGRLVGRAQVLNGVEDDRFWRHGASGGMSRPFARRVREVTIRGGDF